MERIGAGARGRLVARCAAAPGSSAPTARRGEIARAEREVIVSRPSKKREEHAADPDRSPAPPRDPEVRARAARRSRRRCSRTCRTRRCRRCSCSTRRRATRSGERRDARIHLAPDREEARRLRRRGEGARRLSGPGDHALRDRAGGRREGQPDRQPGEGPGARAVGGSRSAWSRPFPASPAWGWRSRTRSGRSVRLSEILGSSDVRTTCTRRSTLALGKDIAGNPVVVGPREDAAPAGRRHHRLGQVGRRSTR